MMSATGPCCVIKALRRMKRRIDSGPVRDPPRPEAPKLCVPIVRFLPKVRKVSWMNTAPALTWLAIGSASSSLPAMTEAGAGSTV